MKNGYEYQRSKLNYLKNKSLNQQKVILKEAISIYLKDFKPAVNDFIG